MNVNDPLDANERTPDQPLLVIVPVSLSVRVAMTGAAVDPVYE